MRDIFSNPAKPKASTFSIKAKINPNLEKPLKEERCVFKCLI